MNNYHLFLQAGGIDFSQFIFPLAIFAIVYFFFLRPSMKKQKEQTKFMDGLKKGDEVVTASGILGRVSKIEEGTNIIQLQVDTKTFIRVTRGAISKEMSESVASGSADKKD